MATKAEIRKAVRQRKLLLSGEQKAEAANRCFSRLEQCPEFERARNVLVYASLPDEISTTDFIQRWHGRKQLFLPRVNGDDLDILPYSPAATAVGAFGISEPTGSDFRDIAGMDLVVVPAMAYDRHGNRLGRGRGFYDRLLRCAVCPLVGTVYAVQIVDCVPAESHDVKVPIIITEEEIIRTK